MNTVTITAEEYQSLLKMKKTLGDAHSKYRQTEKWRKANREAQRRYRLKKKESAM